MDGILQALPFRDLVPYDYLPTTWYNLLLSCLHTFIVGLTLYGAYSLLKVSGNIIHPKVVKCKY